MDAPIDPQNEPARTTGLDRLDEMRELLAEHPAVDLHVDTLGHGNAADILASNALHASPGQARAGGFGVMVYACWIPPHLAGARGWSHLRGMIEQLATLRTGVQPQGGVRFVPALEDARVLAVSEHAVDEIAAWGMAYVTLTWNTGNRWASSWEDTRAGVGLTAAGRRLVEALASRRVRVDLSHLSDRAAEEVLAIAPDAPLASHSSARALCPHPRNVSDRLARAIAERGGVVGVNVFPVFLDRVSKRADIDTVARHVEHLRDVAGEEAVAFGSDFDGITKVPRGLEASRFFPALLARLRARGHSRAFLIRFARTNALRLLQTTPALAGLAS